VLDDVERRGFLVKPAGENPVPALVGLLDVDLHERPGELLRLPRRGGLACAKADDHVLPPNGLAGPERDVLDDPVSLVENPEDCDPLRHGRHSALPRGGRRRLHSGELDRILLLLRAFPARRERESHQQRCPELRHAYSGIHGS
jgi:hypothetical protein